jgi:hypothetical protein
MRELVHREDEHFALIRRTDSSVRKVAMFIHGFRGNYWTTWGPLGNLLNTEADQRAVYRDWDYLFLGYDTRSVATYLDIARLIWTQWRKAARGDPPFDHSYSKFALIGHSLGTLGIRQALCAHSLQPPNMLDALHGVVYFGSPINGSPLANMALLWKIADALEPGSPQLRMLKGWTTDVHPYAPWPNVRVVTGLDDKVVGHVDSEFIDWAGDDPAEETGKNHSELVKPNGWNTLIIDYITACLK